MHLPTNTIVGEAGCAVRTFCFLDLQPLQAPLIRVGMLYMFEGGIDGRCV